MKVKTAVVASVGTISGRMMRYKSRNEPQPSISAASSSSRGTVRMNCTNRKTKKASTARNLGTTSGSRVLIQPSWWKSTYWGTIVTWKGSRIVPNISANHSRLSANRSRAKAKAASVQEKRLPATASAQSSVELRKKRRKDGPSAVQPSEKLARVGRWTLRLGSPISKGGLNELTTIQISG